MLKVTLLLVLTSLAADASTHADPFKDLPIPVQVPVQNPAEETDTTPKREPSRGIKMLPKSGTEQKAARKPVPKQTQTAGTDHA